MSEVALAFFWHQHQPYYPDDVSGENAMPWVRLHGVKDYLGMALHLAEVPEMRCTINLVPSLLVQLLAYTERGATDQFETVARIPAKDLKQDDAIFLLDHYFMASPETMIKPWPRFWELYQRRALGRNSARDALRRFGERDLRDLQTLYNLAWIHPLIFERDKDLDELRSKGRAYTEEDKKHVLDRHRELLKEILPLHRRLAESGQIELTTTPFYHPILPLLLDKKLAREAMPDIKLPRYQGGYSEDAELHVRRAVEHHQKLFGSAPRGMWPAEGSVCQPMISLLARHGIRWIATDEGILNQATQGFVSRDANGHLRNPSHLYRPYRVREGEHELSIVFRDHALSDMIGFHYQRANGADAAHDFVQHLHNIRQAVPRGEPALVSVILDGENCWEHYPDGGVAFLRTLYQLCTRDKLVRSVRLGDYLEQHPPQDTLPHLFAGSWIHNNFAIWIGHEEDNSAWDAIQRTREYLVARSPLPSGGEGLGARGRSPIAMEILQKAWEELYIAEGSDWFWWYGEDHSSAQDALFDQLFRKHLQNVYYLLGEAPPADLSRPIKKHGMRLPYTLPRLFLDVKIDGRDTFFEWANAGRYQCHGDRSAMAMTSQGPMRDVYFGFNREAFLVRIDFDQPAKFALQSYDELIIGFEEPRRVELRIAHPGTSTQRAGWHADGAPVDVSAKIAVAIDKIAECAIAFALIGAQPKDAVHFYVDVHEHQQSRDRAPREGTIAFTRPSPDFEFEMWDV